MPNRVKSPFRLRWKKRKQLGLKGHLDFEKDFYFSTADKAKEFAEEKINEAQNLGKLSRDLESDERSRILREYLRWKEKGVDPFLALEEGSKILLQVGVDGDRLIGSFWKNYVDRKIRDGDWGTRHQIGQQTFYRATKDTLMKLPVKEFITPFKGKETVKKLLLSYRRNGKREARNTQRGMKSKIQTFLYFITSEVEILSRATLNEIFQDQHLFPTGLRPEADNVAISAAQAKYLIGRMAKEKLAGWIVLKLFMGARTLLLQEWTWSIVNWEDNLIHIPKNQTKLKKNAVKFVFSEIPNFEQWLRWAWEIDGKPDSSAKIVNVTQPTVTNLVKKAINANKELFGESDGRKTIRPAETHRNFMRSGFITYGIQKIGVGAVAKIAEDTHNLHKYLALDSSTGDRPESEKFWSLIPEDIDLDNVECLRAKDPKPFMKKPKSHSLAAR